MYSSESVNNMPANIADREYYTNPAPKMTNNKKNNTSINEKNTTQVSNTTNIHPKV